MTTEDAFRWNQRYKEEKNWHAHPRDWLVNHIPQIPASGVALDLAMGLGENSAYLAQRGWQVIGVDISSVAVNIAHKKHPDILAVIADLNSNLFAACSFDLILNFYFLQRSLLPIFQTWLKPGGYLLMETLTQPIRSIKPDIPLDFLLNEDELRHLFVGWKILDYREGWYANSSRGSKSIASIFAQHSTP